MGGIGDFLAGTSWIYLLGAGFTLYQLWKGWRDFLNGDLTQRDRQLASMIAFFLLVPIGVLLHEFGHMLAAWSTGSEVLSLGYFIYWGYVEYIRANNSPLLDWYVSLAGNFLSYALGVVCLLVAVWGAKLKPALRVTLLYLGILQVVQTLIFYPLISLDPGFEGDWDSIYSFGASVPSGVTLAVHGLSLMAFIMFLRRSQTANWLLQGAKPIQRRDAEVAENNQ